MARNVGRFLLAVGGSLCLTAALAAQTSSTSSTQTKSFEVIAVDGNDLVVRLPEGTRDITVPDGFKFTVNGQQLSVSELKPGMKGTAVITTTTHVTPVTVTEIKEGTVKAVSGPTIIVQTAEGFKMFTQTDVDKRGVKIYKGGEPAQLSDFRTNDKLTATIVTTHPPKIVTEKQVEATLAKTAGGAAATAGSSADSPAPVASASQQAGASGAPSATPRHLPKTASAQPLIGLVGMLLLGAGFGVRAARRRFDH